jgi:hypothetical protein
MPWIVPFIPLIAAGATTGTEVGLQLSGALTPSTTGAANAEEIAANQAQQRQQQTAEQEAFKSFAPQAQAQTGGSLADPSLSSLIAQLSGSPADVNLAQQTLFGNAPGLSSNSLGGG